MSTRFITYFTKEFLCIGIVSVTRFLLHHPNSTGYIFVFDDVSMDVLQREFSNTQITIVNIFDEPELSTLYFDLLSSRNALEAITSLKPYFILECLTNSNVDDLVVYFDPDVMYFATSEAIPKKTMCVFSQKGVPLESQDKFGKFNAGLVMIRNSKETVDIIQEWKTLCFNWCKLEVGDGLYADQKYLDRFSSRSGFRFKSDYRNNLSARGFTFSKYLSKVRFQSNALYVNDTILISYQFHGLRIENDCIYSGINRFGTPKKRFNLFFYIYLPVLKQLKAQHLKSCTNLFPMRSEVSRFDKTLRYSNESLKGYRSVFSLKLLYRVSRLTIIPIQLIPSSLSKMRN